MLKRGYRIAAPAASLIFVCFFLPWILVSCGSEPQGSLTGLKLATGEGELGPRPWLYVVPLIGIIVLLMAARARNRLSSSLGDTLGLFLMGLVPFVWLWIDFFGARGQVVDSSIRLSLRIGWWGTTLGLLGLVAGGALNWLGIDVFTGTASPRVATATRLPSPSSQTGLQPPPQTAPLSTTRACSNCGKTVKVGSRFCQYCGHRFEEVRSVLPPANDAANVDEERA